MEDNLTVNDIQEKNILKGKNDNKLLGFIEKIKSGNVPKVFILIIAVVLLLVILLFNFNGGEKKDEQSIGSANSYVYDLEKKLSSVLSKVNGAGKVEVVINVESGNQTVLAMKTIKTTDVDGKIHVEETPVMVNGKTVVLKELNPKIIGVLIVSEGANSLSVIRKLQQATISLLDVNVNQIEILTMK